MNKEQKRTNTAYPLDIEVIGDHGTTLVYRFADPEAFRKAYEEKAKPFPGLNNPVISCRLGEVPLKVTVFGEILSLFDISVDDAIEQSEIFTEPVQPLSKREIEIIAYALKIARDNLDGEKEILFHMADDLINCRIRIMDELMEKVKNFDPAEPE